MSGIINIDVDFRKVNIKNLSPSEIESLHQAMFKDPLLYLKAMKPDAYIYPFSPMHREICEEIKNPSKEELLIEGFRGSSKTTNTLLMFLYKILYQNYKYLQLGSSTEKVATKKFLNNFATIATSPQTEALFGKLRAKDSEWALSSGQIELKNEKLGIHAYVCSVGRDSQNVGLQIEIDGVSYRPQIIGFDDVDIEENMKMEAVDDMMKWYDQKISFSMDKTYCKKPLRVITGTIYNAYSMLTIMEKRDSVKVLRYPIMADFKDDKEIFERLGIPENQSVWEGHPEYCYETQQREKAEAIKEKRFWSYCHQMYLRAYLSTATRFMEEQIKRFDMTEVYSITDDQKIDFPEWNLYLLCDSSYRKGIKNCPAGNALIGIDKNNNIYIIHAWEGKVGDLDLYTEITRFFDKFNLKKANFKFFGMESAFYDQEITLVRDALRDKGYHNIPTLQLKPGNSIKTERIRLLILPCEQGRLYVEKNLDWFVKKMLLFDSEGDGRGFDALDASAYIVEHGRPPAIIDVEKIKDELNRQRWKEMCKQDRDFVFKDISMEDRLRERRSMARNPYLMNRVLRGATVNFERAVTIKEI